MMLAGPSAPIMVPHDHEGSAWWRAALDDAERRARAAQADADEPSLAIVTVGPPTAPGTVEDRTCDRCRTHVSEGEWFTTFVQVRTRDVYIVGGLCEECRALECLPSTLI